MTNADKSRLRTIMAKHAGEYSDADAADECNCAVSTARKYRKWFAKADANLDMAALCDEALSQIEGKLEREAPTDA
jgi:hypothetical protein